MEQHRRRHIRSRNITFSLYQIRLVGLIILMLFFGRLASAGSTAALSPHLVRLSAYGFISNSLPLAPLGISLYLIGGGHRRSKIELKILPLMCRSLNFFAFSLGLILPVALLLAFTEASEGIKGLTLTPYQQELISPSRIIPSITACLITGGGFALLSRQLKRIFHKYGNTAEEFFKSSTS